MKKISVFIGICILLISTMKAQDLQTDRFETTKGELKIQFVKHGSLFLNLIIK